MKITIIGAGIGGLGAALGLISTGHEVQVFEKSEKLRSEGNGLVLWPNGTGILTDLGVNPVEVGTRMDVCEYFSSGGDLMTQADFTDVISIYGNSAALIRRGQVVEGLAARLPEGVLRLGANCVGVENVGRRGIKSAVASFDDGSRVESDILIGADGHRSVVRRALRGDEQAIPTGWAAWHGVTKLPIELASSHTVKVYFGAPGLVALHPIGNGLLFWVFETPWKDGDRVPPPGNGKVNGIASPDDLSVVGNLRSRFGWWADPIPEVLDSITDEDVSLFPFVRHRVPRNWVRGRIALLGDAAHAVPPRTSQGVNQALEDVWVLTRVLARPGNPAAQLREYCAIRRPKVRAVSRFAKQIAGEKRGLPFLRGFIRRRNESDERAKAGRGKKVRTQFSNYHSVPPSERGLGGKKSAAGAR